MGKIQDEILESFYKELAKADEVDEGMVKRLRQLFETGRKLKADAIAAILSEPTGEEGLK